MMTITALFAGFVAVMFAATAATSVMNAYREAAATRLALTRRVTV